MEIFSKHSASKYYIKFIFFVILMILLEIIFNFENLYVLLIFSLIILLSLLQGKYFTKITMTNKSISFIYFRWFMRKEQVFNLSTINIKLISKTVFRGGTFSAIQVIENGRTIIEIEDRDGFSSEDFELLISKFKELKN